jgi:predicted RNA binding protein YcfA (HicA-like mRNA interferase family)
VYSLNELDIMKYSELERRLKKARCYKDSEMGGHPVWYSPLTDRYFKMSNHKSQEVARGTLKSISNDSGVNL